MNKRFLSFLILTSLTGSVMAQTKGGYPLIIPCFETHNNDFTPGHVIYQNGDTLYGAFYISSNSKIAYSRNGVSETRKIPTDSLDHLFLSIISTKIYSFQGRIQYDYIKSCKKLYRLIYVGTNKYYDDNFSRGISTPIDDIGNVMWLINGDPNSVHYTDNSISSPKKALVLYLNTRTDSVYSKKDFQNSIAVIKKIESLP